MPTPWGREDGDLCRVVREAQVAKRMLPETMAGSSGGASRDGFRGLGGLGLMGFIGFRGLGG